VDLYTCLSGLLSWGVPGDHIVLVLDRIYSQDENAFFDEDVMKKVETCILDEGITVHVGWTMRSWQIEDIDFLSNRPEPHIINISFWPQPGAKTIRRDDDNRTIVVSIDLRCRYSPSNNYLEILPTSSTPDRISFPVHNCLYG